MSSDALDGFIVHNPIEKGSIIVAACEDECVNKLSDSAK